MSKEPKGPKKSKDTEETTKQFNLQDISGTLMQLFVQDVFSKNDITKDSKKKISKEQKEQLKKIVEDLQAQVDEFVNATQKKVEDTVDDVNEAIDDVQKNLTLRDLIKQRKKGK